MPSGSPVALILGAGARVGMPIGRAFAAKGYRIALAARTVKEEDSTADQLYIRSDFSDPESIADIFVKVKSQLGTPHVVVYNGIANNSVLLLRGSLTKPVTASSGTSQDAKNPLGLALKDFNHDFTIITTSAFMAAQQAVLAFNELPDSASRTFIYTGNCTNVSPIIALWGSGAAKSASAHLIQCAAEAYKDKGFKYVNHLLCTTCLLKLCRFYYADERKPDGAPAYGGIDGPAHGVLYTELAEGASQGPWQQTFVKGVGYQKF